MILHRALFYKLAEMVIDALFNSIYNNFRLDGGLGYLVQLKDLSVGDKFSKMVVNYGGGYVSTYYGVTVNTIDEEIFNDKIYYSVEIVYMYDERQTHSYAEVTKDLRSEYANSLDEDEHWSEDLILIRNARFQSIYHKIKEYLTFSTCWISDDDFDADASIRVF